MPERKCWFNTIDDSVMKVATRSCPVSWQTQSVCDEMLMGAIHPDLAYYARIADDVYNKAEDILAKIPNKLD